MYFLAFFFFLNGSKECANISSPFLRIHQIWLLPKESVIMTIKTKWTFK